MEALKIHRDYRRHSSELSGEKSCGGKRTNKEGKKISALNGIVFNEREFLRRSQNLRCQVGKGVESMSNSG